MIHYKWIKGFDADSSEGWCFIKFLENEQPHFYVGEDNTDDESELTSYGKFILSDYDAMQKITNGLCIGRRDTTSDYSHSFMELSESSFYVNLPSVLKVYKDSDSYIRVEPIKERGIKYEASKYTYSGANFVFKDTSNDAAQFQFQNSNGGLLGCFSPNGGQSMVTGDSAYYYGNLTFKGGNLIVSNGGHVEAQYFNATSDIRAKKDVNELDFNALDMVKSIPVYTYTYKNNNSHSMGIMAQDLLDYSFNGFDLVDNKEASGENNDYMSVKESKLVFVLWKAVQELTKEVEDLKAQLNK